MEDLTRQIEELRAQLDKLQAVSTIPYNVAEAFRALLISDRPITVRTNNVSNPPTNAELTTAFGGTPAEVGDGFVGLIDNAGASVTVWLVVALNNNWWYESLTAAV